MPGNGAAGASYGDLLVTSLLVLGAVCIAAFVVVRVVGRFLATGRTRGAHLLDVVARLPLEPRRSLYVVEVAGKTLLIGTSEMGLSVLSEIDGDEVHARVAARPSFGDLVRSAWQHRRGLTQPRDGDRSGDRRPEIDFRSASSAQSAEQGSKTPWEEGTQTGDRKEVNVVPLHDPDARGSRPHPQDGGTGEVNALHLHEMQPPVAVTPSERESRGALRMSEPVPVTGLHGDEVR